MSTARPGQGPRRRRPHPARRARRVVGWVSAAVVCTLVLGMGIGARRTAGTQTSTVDRTDTTSTADDTSLLDSLFGSDSGPTSARPDPGPSRATVPDTRSAPSPG